MTEDPNIMAWDDVIESDGPEYVVLPEGDYTFTVTGFERGSYPGGDKVPACPKATITLTIDNDQGIATSRVDLMLCRTLEWKIAAFFRCIGQKKLGEKAVMDWNRIVGARGKAHFRPWDYPSKSGASRQKNDLVYFIDYDPAVALTPVQNEELPW